MLVTNLSTNKDFIVQESTIRYIYSEATGSKIVFKDSGKTFSVTQDLATIATLIQEPMVLATTLNGSQKIILFRDVKTIVPKGSGSIIKFEGGLIRDDEVLETPAQLNAQILKTGDASWGQIGGDISTQTDLQAALANINYIGAYPNQAAVNDFPQSGYTPGMTYYNINYKAMMYYDSFRSKFLSIATFSHQFNYPGAAPSGTLYKMGESQMVADQIGFLHTRHWTVTGVNAVRVTPGTLSSLEIFKNLGGGANSTFSDWTSVNKKTIVRDTIDLDVEPSEIVVVRTKINTPNGTVNNIAGVFYGKLRGV